MGQYFEYSEFLTNAQMREMRAYMEQRYGNRCNICGRKATYDKRLALDHCHKTKSWRGLLCNRCNMGLGYFQDSAELLASAIEYLQTYQCEDHDHAIK